MRKNKMQMLSLLLAGTMVSTTVLPPASVLAAEENGIVAEEGIELSLIHILWMDWRVLYLPLKRGVLCKGDL